MEGKTPGAGAPGGGAPVVTGRGGGLRWRPRRTAGAPSDRGLLRLARAALGSALRALVLELAVGRGAYFAWSSRFSDRLTAAATTYRIDVAAVEKETTEQLAQRRAERGARKSKKTPSSS